MNRFKRTLIVAAMSVMTLSANAYPWLSPYAYCMNNPVKFVDPDGRVIKLAPNSTFGFMANFILSAYYLKINGCGQHLETLITSPKVYTIKEQSDVSKGNYFDNLNQTICWNPYRGIITRFTELSPTTLLNHELDHADLYNEDPGKYENYIRPYDNNASEQDRGYENYADKRAITETEKATARALGEIGENEVTRTEHGDGTGFKTVGPLSNKNVDEFVLIGGSKDD